jgi:hypothetical protein
MAGGSGKSKQQVQYGGEIYLYLVQKPHGRIELVLNFGMSLKT